MNNVGIPKEIFGDGSALSTSLSRYTTWLSSQTDAEAVNNLMAEFMLTDEDLFEDFYEQAVDYYGQHISDMDWVKDEVTETRYSAVKIVYDDCKRFESADDVVNEWKRHFKESVSFDKISADDMSDDLSFYGNKAVIIEPWV